MQVSPAEADIALANWNGKVVRQFIAARCGLRLSRATCLRYLHRLGFADKRPKQRMRKADEEQRAAFVEQYATLLVQAQTAGAKIFFADEAHFRADADLHGKWMRKGQPALVDSTCPRWGEQASDYSAVCLETGEVEQMALVATSASATSARSWRNCANHAEPLIVVWDNGPAHGGEAVRADLATPDVNMQVCRLPAYSPDCNADGAIWVWVREEVTANTCLGTEALVQEKVGHFFGGLTSRTEEVKTRCRTKLQTLAACPVATDYVVLTCASV